MTEGFFVFFGGGGEYRFHARNAHVLCDRLLNCACINQLKRTRLTKKTKPQKLKLVQHLIPAVSSFLGLRR